MNAYAVQSNYSFCYYNFIDFIDDSIDFLTNYAIDEMIAKREGGGTFAATDECHIASCVDAWRSAYVAQFGIDEIIDDDNDELFEEIFYAALPRFDEKPHFVQMNRELHIEQVSQFTHKKLFKSIIAEELIAFALHPSRMMRQIQSFDDIEDFVNPFTTSVAPAAYMSAADRYQRPHAASIG
ncbi:hypothetical protein ON010_g2953 [Phytophthora cinnamomi]|nr:hypothetical protein ON010_g2953 [Phytophthora cinnamomi]